MTTPILGAPSLAQSQAIPETAVNEIVRFLEQGAGWFRFRDRDLATPPGSPAEGDCYLVAAGATGAWAGQSDRIAFFLNGVWTFITPVEGFGAWVNDENAAILYDGSAWGSFGAGGSDGASWSLVSQSGAAIVPLSATITIASPAVVTRAGHGFAANAPIVFATKGALPTGLAVDTTYYVRNPTTNTFEVSATSGGASINTSGTQSGAHTVQRLNSWDWSANVANVDFTGLGSFSELEINFRNVGASINGQRSIQLSTNNGASFYSSAVYLYVVEAGTEAGGTGIGYHGTQATAGRSGIIGLPDLQGYSSMRLFSLPTRTAFGGGFFVGSPAPVNAFRLLNDTGGNITSGGVAVRAR